MTRATVRLNGMLRAENPASRYFLEA